MTTPAAQLTWDPTDPAQPAARANGHPEPPRPLHALLDYLHLGSGRTLAVLWQHYCTLETPPTRSYTTLRSWASSYEWQARAACFDALETERARAEYRAHRDSILQTGLALDHERIDHLKTLYQKLASIATHEEALWITDVKVLHLAGDQIERVELRRFNGELIRHLRGIIEDIAAETGGRASARASIAQIIQPEKPLLDIDDYSLDALDDEERTEFLRLQNKLFTPTPQKTV